MVGIYRLRIAGLELPMPDQPDSAEPVLFPRDAWAKLELHKNESGRHWEMEFDAGQIPAPIGNQVFALKIAARIPAIDMEPLRESGMFAPALATLARWRMMGDTPLEETAALALQFIRELTPPMVAFQIRQLLYNSQ